MVTELKMPKYGLQQDEGTLVQWRKQEGDRIEKGEILCELETDKALFDFEAPTDGYLRKILCDDGQTVPVLSTIAIVSDTADEPFEIDASPVPTQPTIPSSTKTNAEQAAPSQSPAPGAGVRTSPSARRRARELGVDLATVTGTGPSGRIKAEDVEVAASSPDVKEGRRESLSRARKAIGAAMVAAKQTVPHFYLTVDIDVTETEVWWNGQLETRPDLTLTDLIIQAVARSLTQYEGLNASVEGDEIVYHGSVNIGLAVGIDGGLLVPVIELANDLTLDEIRSIRSRIVAEARQGRMSGSARSTFTISNLGMFGVREFSAIINPPETAALAVGAIRNEVRSAEDATGFLLRRIMTLTLSADHRAVDGLIGARYLQTLKTALEDPTTFE